MVTSGDNTKIGLFNDWKDILAPEFNLPYMQNLKNFLLAEKKTQIIYPAGADIFNAFNLTPFQKVKVVIIGQDPYHGENQAHGLCFSVQKGIKPPPSLVNIYKELYDDLGIPPRKDGNLEKWGEQGILLLNAVLTVTKSKPASHQNRGWEIFTDKVIEHLNREKDNLVFILWGSYAQKKGENIDQNKHFVIQSAHPSPFSAYRGFFGSKPFSRTNNYLQAHGVLPIDWRIE